MSERTEIAPHQSPAEKMRARMEALIAAVEGKSSQLSTLLEDSGISFKRFLEVFRRALIQNPDLVKADAGSVIQACINACTDGLLPDGRQGALVIYNVNVADRGQPKQYVKKAQWMPMVQGLLDVAYRSGNFKDIQARVVYEGDIWDYEMGIDPWIKHKPSPRPARAADAPAHRIVASYAVAKGINGGIWVEVFEGEDIRKVAAVGRAASGPAKDWPEEMARKGPVRRMWKYLPKNDQMDRIVEHDDETYDLAALEDEPAAPPRRLTPGFNPQPALTQGADITMDDVRIEPDDMDREMVNVLPTDDEVLRQREAADEDNTRPEVAAFDTALSKAKSWAQVHKALEAFWATEFGSQGLPHRIACTEAWGRMQALRAEGDRTDFVSDPALFECWVYGADPDADSILANWGILEGSEAFSRAAAETQSRVSGLVATRTQNEEDAE